MPIITPGLPIGGLWGYNAENRWLFLEAVCCGLCLQTNMATHFKIIKNLWYRGLKSAVSEIYKDWWLSDLKIEKPFFLFHASYSFTSNSGRGVWKLRAVPWSDNTKSGLPGSLSPFGSVTDSFYSFYFKCLSRR